MDNKMMEGDIFVGVQNKDCTISVNWISMGSHEKYGCELWTPSKALQLQANDKMEETTHFRFTLFLPFS